MNLVSLAYLGSYFLSLLGNAIAAVALPLIVLQTTGSVLGAGAVAAATALPAVVAGVLMGVVIDRIDRRFSSVVTDLVSGASIAALPLIDLVTDLDVGWFVLFGLIGSLGDVPGMTAREALVPAIVRHGGTEAERLVGLRESIGALAVILGPAAAGGLMAAFDGATVLWITAATSFAAALVTLLLPRSVGTIHHAEHSVEPGSSSWSQLRDGWTLLFRSSPFLLATTAMNTALVAVLAATQSLVLPVHFTDIGAPGRLGLVLSAIAAGSLVGGVLFAVLGRRGSRRTWFLLGLAGSALGFAMVGTLPSTWLLFSGAVAMGVASGALGSLLGVLMIERIPEQMRGRVLGTQNATMTAAAPVGIVAAAFLAHHFGHSVAGLALVTVWLVSALLAAVAPAMRNLSPVDDVQEVLDAQR